MTAYQSLYRGKGYVGGADRQPNQQIKARLQHPPEDLSEHPKMPKHLKTRP